jgi:hypothetical protein
MSGRYDLLVVSEFPPGDSRNSDPTRPDGEPGFYLVTFVLAPPGDRTYRADVDFTTLMNGGDSLIETGPEARIGVRHPIAKDVELRLDGNVAGRLAKVSLKVSAEGFTDAAHQAKSIVLPYVSWVSYRHDVAVAVAGYEVLETRSEARQWSFGWLGRIQYFNAAPEAPVDPVLRRLLAAYREGLTATSPLWQVLSLYKVVEGAFKARNVTRSANTLGWGLVERIPGKVEEVRGLDGEMLASMEPYLGRKFTDVRDELRPLLRNAIAHLDPEGSIDSDQPATEAACEQAVAVLKYMAREVIRTELNTAGMKVSMVE